MALVVIIRMFEEMSLLIDYAGKGIIMVVDSYDYS